jgi:hypothetical protein
MILTHAALLALAMQCVSPQAAPLVVALVEHENRCDCGNTEAHGVNPNGTEDWGLGQINSANFGMLSRLFGREINKTTILDPCTNLAASEAVLLARYNGSQFIPLGASYAAGVIAKLNGEIRIDARMTPVSPIVARRVADKPKREPEAAAVFAKPGRSREIVIVDRK